MATVTDGVFVNEAAGGRRRGADLVEADAARATTARGGGGRRETDRPQLAGEVAGFGKKNGHRLDGEPEPRFRSRPPVMLKDLLRCLSVLNMSQKRGF